MVINDIDLTKEVEIIHVYTYIFTCDLTYIKVCGIVDMVFYP